MVTRLAARTGLLAWSCFWRAWRKRRIRVGCFGVFIRLQGQFYLPGYLYSIKAYQLQGPKHALRQVFQRGLPPGPQRQSDRSEITTGAKIPRARKVRQLLVESHPVTLHSREISMPASHGSAGTKVRNPAMSRGWAFAISTSRIAVSRCLRLQTRQISPVPVTYARRNG